MSLKRASTVAAWMSSSLSANRLIAPYREEAMLPFQQIAGGGVDGSGGKWDRHGLGTRNHQAFGSRRVSLSTFGQKKFVAVES
jgi:hypothetical protein